MRSEISRRNDSMFKSIDLPAAEQQERALIRVDGRAVEVCKGQTLATALLGAGVVPFRRTAISGEPRAPLCLMGVCFECLVHVDGMHNVQSCLIEVQDQMDVTLPTGAPPLEGTA
jgi:D-hydroxyproline dehydrogenase subunit gamma